MKLNFAPSRDLIEWTISEWNRHTMIMSTEYPETDEGYFLSAARRDEIERAWKVWGVVPINNPVGQSAYMRHNDIINSAIPELINYKLIDPRESRP